MRPRAAYGSADEEPHLHAREPHDVVVVQAADGFYIVHVESGSEGDYPLVNGSAIGPQARRLHDNDVVQLAGVKMGFFEN